MKKALLMIEDEDEDEDEDETKTIYPRRERI